MKIISKHKDYYDYLQGQYGIDDKLVLDRTKFTPKIYPSKIDAFTFYICGLIVGCLYVDGEFLYGDDVEKYHIFKDKDGANRWWYGYDERFWYVHKSRSYDYFKVPRKLIKDEDNWNEKLNCPILLASDLENDTPLKFPILAYFDMHKQFTPHQMWLMLSEWLGREKTVPSTQTNKEKIVGAGFDLITSFRNIK